MSELIFCRATYRLKPVPVNKSAPTFKESAYTLSQKSPAINATFWLVLVSVLMRSSGLAFGPLCKKISVNGCERPLEQRRTSGGKELRPVAAFGFWGPIFLPSTPPFPPLVLRCSSGRTAGGHFVPESKSRVSRTFCASCIGVRGLWRKAAPC